MKIVAVDIGGTAIKAGLWDGTELTDMKEWDTEASQGGAHLMERVMQLLHTYSGFDAIGISTAGEVNTCLLYTSVAITGIFGIGREKSCSLCGEIVASAILHSFASDDMERNCASSACLVR